MQFSSVMFYWLLISNKKMKMPETSTVIICNFNIGVEIGVSGYI